MGLQNRLEMTERDVTPAFGHLGLKVMDTSFLLWPHEKEDSKEKYTPDRIEYIEKSRAWFNTHADESVVTTQEVYNEINNWIHFIRRSHKETSRFRKDILARQTHGRRKQKKYEGGIDIEETIRTLRILETREKRFRTNWIRPRVIEDKYRDTLGEKIPSLIRIVKNSLPAYNQESANPVGNNDMGIYAKALALSYLAPTTIITRDNHFQHLHWAYDTQRKRAREAGLPDFPYPLYVVIYGKTNVRGLIRKHGQTKEIQMLRPSH